jgi:hypothetical protein
MTWQTRRANTWQAEQEWIVGFNYVPSTAINSTEMWQKSTFDVGTIVRELTLAAETGFNSCRVFLPFLVWREEGIAFMANLETFISIAHSKGLSVVLVLFDDCAFSKQEPYLGEQNRPVSGIHNSGWTPSPGFKVADDPEQQGNLEAYLTTIVRTYQSDSRILMWDLYNEPGNSGRAGKSRKLLISAFQWARECNPEQPLTSGVWSWQETDLLCLELSDVISFHDYRPMAETKERVEGLMKLGRPLFCTEWLHRHESNLIDTHMPYYGENHIGIYSWGLVLGKTQTHLSWDANRNTPGKIPLVWQHDLFHPDLSPNNEDEIRRIKELTRKYRKHAGNSL